MPLHHPSSGAARVFLGLIRIDSMLRVYIDIPEIQARLLRSVSAAFCAPLCSAFRSAFCSVLSRELEVLAGIHDDVRYILDDFFLPHRERRAADMVLSRQRLKALSPGHSRHADAL